MGAGVVCWVVGLICVSGDSAGYVCLVVVWRVCVAVWVLLLPFGWFAVARCWFAIAVWRFLVGYVG